MGFDSQVRGGYWQEVMLDTKIVNGSVLDGTGGPACRTDIGIAGDCIVDTGGLAAVEARTVIDATGMFVCPGFIDAHSHSDTYLLIQPSADSKISQGITTEVVGNCGASAAPLMGNYQLPSDWREKKYAGDWSTVAEYRVLLGRARPAPNVVLLVGHNTLHAGVMGYENRTATAAEVGEMARRLEQCLEEGACGLSTGLIYSPGMFAAREEIVALAAVVGKRGGIYTSHMRSEGKRLIEAIDEVIAIARGAGVKGQISHLKTAGRENWGLIEKALEGIRTARAEGVEVNADRYPYTASCTDLDVIFPTWAAEGGQTAVLARLKDPSLRKCLRTDLLKSRSDDYWKAVMIGSTAHADNAGFHGMYLSDVATRLGLEPVDAALSLMEKDELKTSAFFFGMSEENLLRILAEPYVMIGTDASLRAPSGPLGSDYPHPRAYGSFPRFLRMCLDGKVVPLPEAIRKMTSLPAATFGLHDRGSIKRGAKADMVVFDPVTVRDTAWYDNPHSLATGIEHVLVNGIHTVKDGNLTGERAGQFLAR